MGNSIDEARLPDSDEALAGAKFTADRIVNYLRKDYSDKIIRMAFEAALNESYDGLFNIIYESAIQLREDTAGSTATYFKTIKNVLKEPIDYGAAVQNRITMMAKDPTISDVSYTDFRKNLQKSGITDTNILAACELYFYRTKYSSTFETAILPKLSSLASTMYTTYKNALNSKKEAAIQRVRDEWDKNTKKQGNTETGFLTKVKGFLGLD